MPCRWPEKPSSRRGATAAPADLYNTIRTSMPYGNPGSLDAATYANLVAFILQANGATPGSAAFTPATAVKISTVASGTVPADIQRGIRPAQTAAARARPRRQPGSARRRPAPTMARA